MSTPDNELRLFTYGWLTAGQRSVFLPLHAEDAGKSEMVTGFPWIEFTSAMLGAISGAVEPGETPIEAIIREALEEQRLKLLDGQTTNGLPEVIGAQKRSGKEVFFRGIGHQIRLSAENLLQLQEQHAQMNQEVIVVPNEGLARFLRDNARVLRPFVLSVGWQLWHRI